MTNFIPGDVSGSQTLTDNDHLYPDLISELRQSRAAAAVVGRTSKSEYYCDGTADNVQIQAAIDSVSEDGGGTVHIKKGTYSLGETLEVPGGVWLEGEGFSTVLFAANDLEDNVVINKNQSSGDTNVAIRNLTIDGNKTNQTTVATDGNMDGIYFSNVSFSLLENLKIVNVKNRAIQGWYQTNDSYFGIKKSIISNVYIDNCRNGIELHGYSDYNTIGNIYITNLEETGQGLKIYATSRYNMVDNVSIFNDGTSAAHGVEMRNNANYNVLNNIFIKNVGGLFSTTERYGFVIHSSTNNSVNNLVIYGGEREALILTTDADHNNLSGVTVVDAWRQGIFLSGADYNVFSGIRVLNSLCNGAPRSGIRVNASFYNRFCSGIITDNQATKTQEYGVEEVGGSDYNDYVGLDLRGNKTGSSIGLGANSNLHVSAT